MKRVMSLVDLQREEVYIKELTEDRPIASLPFAGRYRLVDFALSSMVTSGIVGTFFGCYAYFPYFCTAFRE